mmetsp:Transcript_86927/g.223804  ORF Transcript_86927/g.223804 Transcript_86927/m.223804 type:complete len:289 (-) Transcript_86927:35-901(-)
MALCAELHRLQQLRLVAGQVLLAAKCVRASAKQVLLLVVATWAATTTNALARILLDDSRSLGADDKRSVLLLLLLLLLVQRRALLPRVALPVEERDAETFGETLLLKVGQPCVQNIQLVAAGDGKPYEACEQTRAVAVRADGRMHGKPNCQDEVGETGGIRHIVQSEQEGWWWVGEETNAVVQHRHFEEERSNHVVQFHLPDRELHQVADVFAEEREPLYLHLEPQLLALDSLILVELVILTVVPKELVGNEAQGTEHLHAAHGYSRAGVPEARLPSAARVAPPRNAA